VGRGKREEGAGRGEGRYPCTSFASDLQGFPFSNSHPAEVCEKLGLYALRKTRRVVQASMQHGAPCSCSMSTSISSSDSSSPHNLCITSNKWMISLLHYANTPAVEVRNIMKRKRDQRMNPSGTNHIGLSRQTPLIPLNNSAECGISSWRNRKIRRAAKRGTKRGHFCFSK
jgi:hypothetical protein